MLRDRIKAETVAAMKAGDKERLAALRLIGAKIKDRDIEQRTASAPVDDDALVTDVLLKMAKQRQESIALYTKGGRTELAEQERAELNVIESFLPERMDEAAMKEAIARLRDELGAQGPKDIGRVMAALKARHGASLDMARASALVKDALSE
ncbi:GatB/YqeY domain-containing protein [Erythrobacteraceae bacterium CFH 75059]|uniref:GatB/YqeY domain-containing protein n=1 Tax=Qipengyuania thermophila TaxID=2509361 RepID=UPI00102179AB|nr:GatB/YqeY domain-containing protein [Qipengyuania thermophila]TCD05130.1 GatB/YqeY domain-containing protein [Erythrobacteraceae bacterium CFH 75059]